MSGRGRTQSSKIKSEIILAMRNSTRGKHVLCVRSDVDSKKTHHCRRLRRQYRAWCSVRRNGGCPSQQKEQLCNVTDARRLSRCHNEDLLRMQSDDRIVLYFKVNTKSTNLCGTFLPKLFKGEPWVVASAQRDAGIGGDVTTIAGKK